MSIYSRQLKNGLKYFYKFDYKRKQYRSEAIYSTRNEAKQAEANKLKQIEEFYKNPDKKNIIYLFDAIDQRLDYVKTKESEKYYINTKRYLKILLKYFENIPINEIKKAHIEDMLIKESKLHKTKRGSGFYTINSMLRGYKTLFNYTIENYDLDMKNPCNGVKPYPVDKKIKYIPSDSDIEKILSICDERQRKLLEFLRDTGARLNEALNLKGKDIMDTYVILYTRKSKDSNLILRKVPKPNCLKNTIFQSEDFVFGDWNDKPKFLLRKIQTLRLKTFGFHCFRHRYASVLSKQGKPLFEIMSLLGHSNLETTQRYLHLLP